MLLIGPGLYKATNAIMSSNLFGFMFIKASRIPALSSWNKPTVWPRLSSWKILGSSNWTLFISIIIFFFFRNDKVLFITVKVFKPSRSNFTRPAFSDVYISNWVEGKSEFDDGSLYKGINSARFTSGITTPAAWVAIFLFNPSNFFEISISFFTLGSLSSSFLNLGSWAMACSKESGREGSNGIILHNASTYP